MVTGVGLGFERLTDALVAIFALNVFVAASTASGSSQFALVWVLSGFTHTLGACLLFSSRTLETKWRSVSSRTDAQPLHDIDLTKPR